MYLLVAFCQRCCLSPPPFYWALESKQRSSPFELLSTARAALLTTSCALDCWYKQSTLPLRDRLTVCTMPIRRLLVLTIRCSRVWSYRGADLGSNFLLGKSSLGCCKADNAEDLFACLLLSCACSCPHSHEELWHALLLGSIGVKHVLLQYALPVWKGLALGGVGQLPQL